MAVNDISIFEQGGINANGSESSSTTRIRSYYFTDENRLYFTVKQLVSGLEKTLKLLLVGWDENDIVKDYKSWYYVGDDIELSGESVKYRIVLAYDDNSVINEYEIESCVIESLGWIFNNELINTAAIETPSIVMIKPYPDVLWRIDSTVEEGFPYNKLQLYNEEIYNPVKFTSSLVYKVYIDDDVVYSTNVPNPDYVLINPQLTLEVSKAGTFEFVLPPTHPYYNDIKRFKTKIKIYKNDTFYWEGRVLTEENDIFNQKTIVCEGELAYLNDTRQPQREYSHMTAPQIMESVIKIHNSKVEKDKMFSLGYIPAEFPQTNEYYYTQFQSTMDVVNDLAEKLDCYIRVYHEKNERKIELIKEFNTTSVQKIIFGLNIEDFTRSYDMANLVTALLPLGEVTTDETKQIGDELTPNGSSYILTTGEALIEEEYDDGGVRKKTIMATNKYPGTDTPLPQTFHIAWLTVNAGETYYITSRLPNDYGFIFYALMFPDSYRVYDVKTSGSGIGYTDITQVKVTIPEGVTSLRVCGDTEYTSLSIYSSRNLPDELDKYVTVESVNNGDMYVKAEPRQVTTYDQYGNPTTVTVDPLAEFGYIEKTLELSDIKEPSKLLEMAKKYLSTYQFDQMEIEINAVDAVALGVDVQTLEPYQNVRVVSPYHGLDRLFPIDKIEIPLNNPEELKVTLNSETDKSYTAKNNSIDSDLFSKLSAIQSTSSVLEAAKNSALQLIKTGTSGIVSLNVNEETGYVNSITISSEPDWESSDNYWIWNQGGLAFVRDGDKLEAAITNDGHIVANFITTGTMYGDRIRGGTLALGAVDGQNGEMIVYDADGKIICRLDQNGADILGRIMSRNSDGYWVNVADGSIAGGYNDKTHFFMDAKTTIIDEDTQTYYNGLYLNTDAFDIRTNMLAVNGKIGNTASLKYLNDYSDLSYTTDTIEYVSSITQDSDGNVTPQYSEFTFVTDVSLNKHSTEIYFTNGLMTTIINEE